MQTQSYTFDNKNLLLSNPIPAMDRSGFISIYNTHSEAEAAVKQMEKSGFDMKKLSIVGLDYRSEENVVGYYNMGDRTKYWGKLGAFWGGLWGLLFGSALFVIPGLGPLVVAGSFVAALVGVVEGAVVMGGLSAFGAALFGLGIPQDSIVQYETDLKAGRYMMIAHGTVDDLKKARDVVKNCGATSMTDFDAGRSDEPKTETTH